MTDRPIIFSAPMVRALAGGRKTQTRRLANSPLQRCLVGDRLYVRESWSHSGIGVWSIADARIAHTGRPLYMATHSDARPLRSWPSIHMPREFSRLTLIVEGVRTEPLHNITEADAKAEGLRFKAWEVEEGDDAEIVDGWSSDRGHAFRHSVGCDARDGFKLLWNSLHSVKGQHWADNPDVVALTFRVIHGNIDQVPS